MDPNQSDDERNNFFEVDDETNMWFMMHAYEYNQRLEEEQNKPCLTRNSVHRDREDAERRLMADYFDHYSLIVCTGNEKIVQNHGRSNTEASANNDINVLDNSPLFDDLLDDIAHVAPFVMAFSDWNEIYANPSRSMQRTWIERCDVQRRKAKELRDKEVHLTLQRNLMEHIWQQREDQDEKF
ncbi:hypothetical protein Tco_0720374 [Tanacetum coccineum]